MNYQYLLSIALSRITFNHKITRDAVSINGKRDSLFRDGNFTRRKNAETTRGGGEVLARRGRVSLPPDRVGLFGASDTTCAVAADGFHVFRPGKREAFARGGRF